MKTCLFTLFFCLVSISGMFSQESIIVKPGHTIKDYFKPGERYLYDSFETGIVLFKSGVSVEAPLNFCKMYGEIHFLKNKDTLAIANPADLRWVIIQKDTFFYNHGYLLVLKNSSLGRLCRKQFLQLINIRKGDAYGMTSNTTAVSSYTNIDVNSFEDKNLQINQEMILSKKLEYYFTNPDGAYTLFNKANILKTYPKKRKTIEGYLKLENINFVEERDILKLYEFLGKI